jgi:hypothetical protein
VVSVATTAATTGVTVFLTLHEKTDTELIAINKIPINLAFLIILNNFIS